MRYPLVDMDCQMEVVKEWQTAHSTIRVMVKQSDLSQLQNHSRFFSNHTRSRGLCNPHSTFFSTAHCFGTPVLPTISPFQWCKVLLLVSYEIPILLCFTPLDYDLYPWLYFFFFHSTIIPQTRGLGLSHFLISQFVYVFPHS